MGKGQKFSQRMTFYFLLFSQTGHKLAFPDLPMSKLLTSSSSGLTSVQVNIYPENCGKGTKKGHAGSLEAPACGNTVCNVRWLS